MGEIKERIFFWNEHLKSSFKFQIDKFLINFNYRMTAGEGGKDGVLK